MALNIYVNVEKGLKPKAKKFRALIRTFVEVRGEKLLGGALLAPPSWIGLKQFKGQRFYLQ